MHHHKRDAKGTVSPVVQMQAFGAAVEELIVGNHAVSQFLGQDGDPALDCSHVRDGLKRLGCQHRLRPLLHLKTWQCLKACRAMLHWTAGRVHIASLHMDL